jgi:hypothetical protein
VARERPELVRQAGRWFGLGLLPWAIVGRRDGRRAASRGAGWWVCCGTMVYWHLGMLETPDGRPRPLGGADALTLTRAWLVPVAWERPSCAVGALGGLTDALDGVLARRGEPTRAGRHLEGLVDLCLALAVLRGSARHDLVTRTALALEASRLGVGMAYSLASYFGRVSPPSRSVLDAGRALSPVRVTSQVMAARGHRSAASVLLGGAAAAGALGGAVGGRRARTAGRSPLAMPTSAGGADVGP